MSLELNDDWISNFEKTDNLYQEFYKEDLYYVNLHYIYINNENVIDKIKQEPFLMTTPNYITREQILGMLKRNTTDGDRQYSILSILKYNITLDSDDIKHFITEKHTNKNKDIPDNRFLTTIKNIDAITFEKSIHMFQDLNDLFFIFYEKPNTSNKLTPNNVTRRIYLNSRSSHKRTIRKQYKD